jgi:peptide/nickel transport system ATP-binding protein
MIQLMLVVTQDRSRFPINCQTVRHHFEVINVEKEYFLQQQVSLGKSGFKAVNDVSFKLYDGETLG